MVKGHKLIGATIKQNTKQQQQQQQQQMLFD